ncbi:hypothetical protein HU200_066233 [Digitaria exilis]|uniref:Uncharacterized protein n=1 Tax=Digitaria exilis TaxID=1010633 RepID=A0A835A1F3_9POAL|nr:hypothetical protein HU200_066233 [Digitaria exilis]
MGEEVVPIGWDGWNVAKPESSGIYYMVSSSALDLVLTRRKRSVLGGPLISLRNRLSLLLARITSLVTRGFSRRLSLRLQQQHRLKRKRTRQQQQQHLQMRRLQQQRLRMRHLQRQHLRMRRQQPQRPKRELRQQQRQKEQKHKAYVVVTQEEEPFVGPD